MRIKNAWNSFLALSEKRLKSAPEKAEGANEEIRRYDNPGIIALYRFAYKCFKNVYFAHFKSILVSRLSYLSSKLNVRLFVEMNPRTH